MAANNNYWFLINNLNQWFFSILPWIIYNKTKRNMKKKISMQQKQKTNQSKWSKTHIQTRIGYNNWDHIKRKKITRIVTTTTTTERTKTTKSEYQESRNWPRKQNTPIWPQTWNPQQQQQQLSFG